MTTIEDDPRWFECWRNPVEFFRVARQQGALIPLCKALPKHLREAYVAGLFAIILNDDNPCTVRLVPKAEEPPDFQIKQHDTALGFENVIADRLNRPIYAEHRKWNETLKSGGVVHTEKSAERWQVLEAIPERIQKNLKDTTKRKSTFLKLIF
jgi:hypothetical protein